MKLLKLSKSTRAEQAIKRANRAVVRRSAPSLTTMALREILGLPDARSILLAVNEQRWSN